MQFGEILSELRKDRGMRQKELADFLNVTVGTISNYEKGVHMPDLESLKKLADYFSVSTDYLLGRTNFIYDVAILNDEFHNNITLYETMNTITSFNEKNKSSLLDYLELLSLREEKKKKGRG